MQEKDVGSMIYYFWKPFWDWPGFLKFLMKHFEKLPNLILLLPNLEKPY